MIRTTWVLLFSPLFLFPAVSQPGLPDLRGRWATPETSRRGSSLISDPTLNKDNFASPRQSQQESSISRTAIQPGVESRDASTDDSWIVFKNWNEGNAVVAESDSIVWVGTSVGLVRWNVRTETYDTFDESNGLKFTGINSLALDQNAGLWIAADEGVALYSEDTFTHYDHTNSPLPENAMAAIVVDHIGRVVVLFESSWFDDGGVAVFDGSNWQILSGPKIYSYATHPMCVYHDTTWIGGSDALYILVGNNLTLALNWNMEWAGVYSLVVDYQDSLWMEVYARKTLKYLGGSWRIVIDRDKMSLGDIWYEVWNDPRGGLWLSRNMWWFDFGMFRLDIDDNRNGVRCTPWLPPGLCEVPDMPFDFAAHDAISETAQFFAHKRGLMVFNGSSWRNLSVERSVHSNTIYTLGTSRTGEVYFSGELALQSTDGVTWDSLGDDGWLDPPIRFHPNGSLWMGGIPTDPPRYATGLDFDGYGKYWGSYGSIMKCCSPFQEWTYEEMGIPHYAQFMDVVVDRYERIWAAGWYYGGVMYDRLKWYLFPPSDETLPNYDYDMIFADSRDRIWFGTNQSSPNYGFTVYDGNTWTTFYSPGSYSISYLYQMTEDHFGNLWFATGGGLLKYDGTTWTIFDNENSGLRSNTVYGVAVDLWGNVWAGTTTGLCVYNPSGVKLGPYEYESPVDSLSVNLLDGIVAASFVPESHEPVSYHLERGRGAHKFWKVADLDLVPDDSSGVVLFDTSTIIGTYYYRIKEVASDGRARYSEWKQILGGSTGVTLISFQSYTAEQVLRLRWFTESEAFIARYEVLSRHPDSSAFVMIRSVSPSSSGSGSYDVEASSLTRESKTEEYALHVVYLDSSRAELERITVDFSLPLQIEISSNYPNPFNASTSFNVELPEPGMVSLKMYDILGRELTAKFDQFLPEGYNRVSVDLKSQSSGVYFYILRALGVTRTGRMLLLK